MPNPKEQDSNQALREKDPFELEKVFGKFITLTETLEIVGSGLTQNIQKILAEPNAQWDLDSQLPEYLPIFSATKLSYDTPQLREGFDLLARELTLASPETTTDFTRTIALFLIATSLLDQIKLPGKRRFYAQAVRKYGPKISPREGMELNKRDEETYSKLERNPESYDNLGDAINKFMGSMGDTIGTPARDDESLARRQIYIIDSAFRFVEDNGTLYRFWKLCADPETQERFSAILDAAASVFSNAPSGTLALLREEMEDVNPYTRGILWRVGWESGIDKQKLAEYFFAHAEINGVLWAFMAAPYLEDFYLDLDNELSKIEKTEILKTQGIKKVWKNQPIFDWFLAQDPQLLDKFFETTAIEVYDEKEQAMLIRRLIGISAIFKTRFPDHPNIPLIQECLNQLAQETESPPTLSDLLDVFGDAKAGVIYFNPNFEAVARTPRPGQTKEDLLAELKRQKSPIIYVSKAPWPEEKTPQVSEPKQEGQNIISGEIAQDELWGEVQRLNHEQQEKVLALLNQHLLLSGITHNHAENLAQEYQRYARDNGFVVIPGLFPQGNALRRLADIGVIAIYPQNGSFAVLVDGQKLGINTPASTRIVLTTDMGEEKYTESVLAHLLFAASLLSRHLTALPQLDKSEVSTARGIVNDWNKRAKEQHLPQLRFDEKPSIGGKRAVFLIGKKVAVLSLVA